MEISIYIGNTKLDYNDEVNCEYSVMDFREFQSGGNNTSYTINLPLTDLNRRMMKYSDDISVIDEVLEEAIIFVDDIQILKGKLKVLSCSDKYIKVIVSANDYLKELEEKTLQDLNTTAYDFTHNATNIIASWSASNGFIYRYPKINYGDILLEPIFPWMTHPYKEADLIPFFNLQKIVESIFLSIGFTINSTFLNSTWFKDLYITPKEFVNDSEHLNNNDFEYAPQFNSDNTLTVSVPNGSTGFNVIFEKDPIVNNKAVLANADYSTTSWTCSRAGTYKFEAIISYTLSLGSAVRTGGTTEFSILKNGIAIATDTTAITSSTTRTITSEYIDCQVGDIVKAYANIVQTVNNTSGSATNVVQTLTTASTDIKTILMNEQNLYIGRNYPLKINEWLQDTSMIDFITGIKQLFNLCFFVDNWNKTVYIEPFETFIGTSINTIRDVQYMSKSKEYISKEWSKKIHIDFKDDDAEFSLKEYNEKNNTKSGRKTVTLNSVYNKKDIDTFENDVFSTFGIYSELAILDDIDKRTHRIKDFNTKICHWDGLVSGSWTFEDVVYGTYPKVSVLDQNSIYNTYFAKYFHLIDQGIMVTITAPTDLIILTQFNTVVNDATTEGFRTLYQFDYEGETHLGILQTAVTDGYKTKYTLLLIK